MQREATNLPKLAAYVGLLLIVFVLETARGVQFSMMGLRVDVLPVIVAAAGLRNGPVAGLTAGLTAGILYDVSMSGAEGLYPLYYMLFGVLAGLVGERFLRRVFPSALLLSTLSGIVIGLLRFGVSMLFQRSIPPVLYFRSMCGELLVAALFSPLAYLAVRAVDRSFAEKPE